MVLAYIFWTEKEPQLEGDLAHYAAIPIKNSIVCFLVKGELTHTNVFLQILLSSNLIPYDPASACCNPVFSTTAG